MREDGTGRNMKKGAGIPGVMDGQSILPVVVWAAKDWRKAFFSSTTLRHLMYPDFYPATLGLTQRRRNMQGLKLKLNVWASPGIRLSTIGNYDTKSVQTPATGID